MSKPLDDVLEDARTIRDNLKRLGAGRKVALSVHVTKEVLAATEERAERLLARLEALQGGEPQDG